MNENYFNNFLVNKPWGSEYIIYKNIVTATWLLNLKYNQKTSLHCHPKKKNRIYTFRWKS